jgi:hypothetical protein
MPRRETQVKLDGLPLRLCRLAVDHLRIRLSFEPFKNPKIEWHGSSNTIVATFDYIGLDEEFAGADDWRVQFLLTRMAEDISKGERPPPTVDDEVFGLIRWAQHLEHWEAEVEFPADNIVSFSIIPWMWQKRPSWLWRWLYPPKLPSALLERSREMAKNLVSLDSEWRECITTGLLTTYNEGWNDDLPIDSAVFQSKLMLRSVHLDDRLFATAYYDDGDLFLNHSVAIDPDPDGKIKRKAYLAG